MVALLVYALLLFVLAAVLTATALRGNRKIILLRSEPPEPPAIQPMVSIVVAARNEAASIGAAVRALFAQDYKNYEILIVNDRSEDATGQILAELQQQFPQLQILTIAQLPPGWLGKNHALQTGAHAARGELILFTDADVMMEPTTLARAVGYMSSQKVEHLVLTPRVIARGLWMNAFLNFTAVMATAVLQPWRVRDPKSSNFIGSGAFNMVRKEAYLRIGGHQRIPLRPDDDFALGKVLKRAGVRQDFVFGRGLVEVVWYPSMRQLIAGTEKNLFALHAYMVSVVIAETLIMPAVFVAPFVLLGCLPALAGWLGAAAAALLLLTSADSARAYAYNPIYCCLFPLGVLISIFLTWNSTIKNLRRGGIVWRGTLYPLTELRKNKVD